MVPDPYFSIKQNVPISPFLPVYVFFFFVKTAIRKESIFAIPGEAPRIPAFVTQRS